MPDRKTKATLLACTAALLIGSVPLQAGDAPADNDVVMKAMVDELERSMKELALGDLPRPYFIQYRVVTRNAWTIVASYGGLQRSNMQRTRTFGSRARVGSYELDNTNTGASMGGRAVLPLDDDYTALRHAMWRATDQDYKQAVEILTRKVAYLKDKTIEDRPDDFSPAEPVTVLEPPAEIEFDREHWESLVRLLSARFKDHPAIQDSNVALFAGAETQWIVHSEGTRLRTGDTGAYIMVAAEIQAEEGMLLYDNLSYLAKRPDELVPIEEMLREIDEMCGKLTALSEAPILEHYAGPVLFEPIAAGKVFDALFADGVCAKPIPLGGGGNWGESSFERKLGSRILPRSFQVYDDPRPETFEDTLLAASYRYDDEAVSATRVSIVEDGILTRLLASRAPSRKVKRTTGHARTIGFGGAMAHAGCLYISDDDAVTAEALKSKLISAAREEGIEYGLRVASMEEGAGERLGRPIHAFKVYVDDGREELVRGIEFLPVQTRSLKRILAGGQTRKVFNSIAGIASSVISPAILFEELDLTKFKEEFDKPPILKSPAARDR